MSVVFFWLKVIAMSNFNCDSWRVKLENTVKLVYNDYLQDPKIVVVVDGWSLFRGNIVL